MEFSLVNLQDSGLKGSLREGTDICLGLSENIQGKLMNFDLTSSQNSRYRNTSLLLEFLVESCIENSYSHSSQKLLWLYIRSAATQPAIYGGFSPPIEIVKYHKSLNSTGCTLCVSLSRENAFLAVAERITKWPFGVLPISTHVFDLVVFGCALFDGQNSEHYFSIMK